jgi:prefoldin alpha subunit
MSSDQIQSNILEYSKFIDNVLSPDLKSLVSEKTEIETEINDYKELGQQLRNLATEAPEEIESTVDLGYETIFCRAVAENPSTVFVHVGMGFHVELTLVEAIEFVTKRISLLETGRLSKKETKIQEVNAHIDSARQILIQLHHELKTSR